jgi:hypothetical protein
MTAMRGSLVLESLKNKGFLNMKYWEEEEKMEEELAVVMAPWI